MGHNGERRREQHAHAQRNNVPGEGRMYQNFFMIPANTPSWPWP